MSVDEIQQIINSHLCQIEIPKILEAGCGSISKIRIPINSYLVGIDISQKQLNRNDILSEKILGDIQYYDFKKDEYDLIVCRHVLEHLDNPKKVMTNFIKAVKNDGLILIISPNPYSIKGFITKFTPHWFHILVYRYIYGRKDAGKNDTAPFRTHLRFFISPKSLIKIAMKNGYTSIYYKDHDALDGWVGDFIKNKSRIMFFTLHSLHKLISKLSFNIISKSEFVLILKKSNQLK